MLPISIFTLILVSLTVSVNSSPPPECSWEPWGSSSAQKNSPCPRKQKLAYIQQHNSTFQARCCIDKESMKKERKYAQQCNTTLCLTTPRELDSPCDTLTPKYYIHGKLLRYEAGLEDGCKDPQTGRRGKAVVCCPKKSLDRLLLSAQAAEEDEFPHMGSTGTGCGCTVYNREFLISAAHCFVNTTTGEIQNLRRDPVNVTLGTNLNNINSTIHSFPIDRVIVHPEFSLLKGHPERTRKVKRFYNDIALIKLKRKINFERNQPKIRALPLAPVNFDPGVYADQVIILGWGTTGFGTGSQHLQKANLLLRDKDVCFHKNTGRFKYASEFRRQFLCLGGIVNGSASGSAGGGDSGGPAICRGSNGEALLCGVSSFGADVDEDECGEQQTEELCFPSVFDDIGYFRNWIEDNAGRQHESELYNVKLYGDEDIPEDKFLHQVHVTAADGTRCGGTLVALDAIVTSAHCVLKDDGREKKGVRVSTFVRDLNRKLNQRNTFTMKNLHYPRNFTSVTQFDSINQGTNGKVLFRERPYAYDIAVVKLDRKVTGISRSQLARLPEKNIFEPGPAIEISFPLDTSRSGRLLQRQYEILSPSDCKTRFKRFKLIGVDTKFHAKENIMCGVEKYSGGSTCDRELGGGLICRNNILCGIQTFRTCHLTIPNGFLGVAQYTDWIRSAL